jgi:hypothetical protein
MIYILYGLYNLIYQIATIVFLFFANTYLNSFVIPDNLKWRKGILREDLGSLVTAQTILLLVEAGILMLLMYYINKLYLLSFAKADNAKSTALWTAGIFSVITLGFIIVLIYVVFK